MKSETNEKKRTISVSFLRGLILIVIVGFLLSMLLSWTLQTRQSNRSAERLLRLNIEDVRNDIIDASDANLLKVTKMVAAAVEEGERDLDYLMRQYDVAEINVIDDGGVITASTNGDFVGYDMHSGAQAAEFCVLLGSEAPASYVQSYQPISYDASISRKYAAVSLFWGGMVQVGYDFSRFQRDIDEKVVGTTRNRHVGEGGCVLIADEAWNIVSDPNENEGQPLSVSGLEIDRSASPEWKPFRAEVYGKDCYCMYAFSEGYYIIASMPQNEIVLQRDTSVRLNAGLEVMVFLALFVMVFALVQKLVVRNINRVNTSLSKITEGDLDEVVDVRTNVEFDTLSDDINSTVNTLKRYITEAAARIDQELEIAKAIQLSVLPRDFPAFPERTDFDVYASMDPAKEVGGDFYDFFLIDERRIGLVMADVSGKGIPAAMFMMTAKTLIKNRTLAGGTPAEILSYVNRQLCEGNDAELFVTVWLAILDLQTGKGLAANAGHEHPAVRRADGSYELVVYRHSPAVAMMEDIPFREHEFALQPGDSLFVYTDGVPEATNGENELFGTKRMLDALNRDSAAGAQQLLRTVRAEIDAFVDGAPQFDDITMLCIQYHGPDAANGANGVDADNVPVAGAPAIPPTADGTDTPDTGSANTRVIAPAVP